MEKKQYYRISEVVEILGLEKASVIRYWEQEIKLLNPRKSSNGNRLYTQKDINILMSIKRLKEEGYKLEGINRYLVNKKKANNIDRYELVGRLKEIKSFLSSLVTE